LLGGVMHSQEFRECDGKVVSENEKKKKVAVV
jgi:hypothetical protein